MSVKWSRRIKVQKCIYSSLVWLAVYRLRFMRNSICKWSITFLKIEELRQLYAGWYSFLLRFFSHNFFLFSRYQLLLLEGKLNCIINLYDTHCGSQWSAEEEALFHTDSLVLDACKQWKSMCGHFLEVYIFKGVILKISWNYSKSHVWY